MSNTAKLNVFTIGEARIVTPTNVLDPSAQITFAAALVLALEGRMSVPRRKLEELLWNSADSQSSHRLRQTLLKLRRLGIEVESVGKAQLRIREETICCDFDNWVPDDAASTPGVVELMPFGSYNPTISAQFGEWLERQRTAISSIISHAVLHKIVQCRLSAEWISVESWCRSLLEVTPLNEEATLALAEAMAMRGAKHEATHLLDEYLSEIGTGPADLGVQARVMRARIADRIAPRASHTSDAALVGRSKTMRSLAGMLRRSKLGEAQVCLIVGDAGIGKSRVLSELAQFAALQGFTPIAVNARSSHLHRPLSTFVELAPQLRSLPGAIGCSADTLRFLDLLTKHEPRRESKAESLGNAAWIFSAVQTALFDLIDAVAEESPLLIELEDIHWVDQLSSDVLRELIHRLADKRVFFALTAREIPEDWQTSSPAGLSTLCLDPLDAKQSAELIMSLVRYASRTMEKRYLDWCVNVAEGNPYYLTELTNHWIETGIEHEVPASLTAVLKRRISRLDSDALQVLQTCALLENNSTLSRVEAVLQHEAHTLLNHINTLGAAGMIVTDAVDAAAPGADRVASRHELLSSVAMMQLTIPARRFLHRRIGQVLEREIDEHYSAATLWDCAKHWQLAGDQRRAWGLATSCASHLLKVGLPTAAAQAYQKSLPYCSTDLERLDVLKAQALAFYRMSAWLSLRETIVKVRSLERRCSPGHSEHDELELMDLRAQWQSLNWDAVLARALACLHASDASSAHRCEAGVMALMLLGFQSDADGMSNVFNTIETLGSDIEVCEATKLQARMVFHTHAGNLDEAVSAARNLVIEQKSGGDIGDLFRAYCNAGVTLRVAGLFAEASALFAGALMIAKKHNLRAAEQRAIPLIANMALEIGNTEEARQLYHQLCQIHVDPTNRFAFLERQALAERLALYDGRKDEIRGFVPMTFQEAASDPIHQRRTYNLALYVVAELAANGTVSSEAVDLLEKSFACSRSCIHQAFNAFVLYAALKKNGDSNRATSVLEAYRTRYRREPWQAPDHLLRLILRNCGVT